MRLLNYVLIK